MSQPLPSAEMSFPCGNCGAKLSYDAGTASMTCPYCGHHEAIRTTDPAAPAAVPAQIREIPLEEGMRLAVRGLGASVTTIGCKDCGATVNVGQGERTTVCAFCGSNQVLPQETNQGAIRPESLLPFRVPKADANQRFGAWLGTLWFRPSNLKKMANVQEMGGVYVPFWTFDSLVQSQWSAERGWHYYETESYTTTENGQSVTRTRQVQRTRWESASGYRQDDYEDVLVCAGKGLPDALVDKFSSFDTKHLVPYSPEFLAGWRAESYAIDLMPGWGVAQQKIARGQDSKCAGDIGGDTHRSLSVNNQYFKVTFKHILLPIWIAAYRYNKKVYRFLVHGQTGEVVGEAPWSFWKIFALVAAILALIGGLIAWYSATQSGTATPAYNPSPTATSVVIPIPTTLPTFPTATATFTATATPTATHHPPHPPPTPTPSGKTTPPHH